MARIVEFDKPVMTPYDKIILPDNNPDTTSGRLIRLQILNNVNPTKAI